MENPFILLDQRLSRVENLLIELKHTSKLNTAPAENDIISIQQASELTGYAVQTLYGKVSRNEIPFMKRGKKLWFSRKHLINWIGVGHQHTLDDQVGDFISSIGKKHRKKINYSS
jgi:predicted DNA-binding transcriptional regulator AlpA